MSRAVIGVCVIGAGRAGMIHAGNFATAIPGACLAGLADPSQTAIKAAQARLPGAKAYADYRQALEDKQVNAVVVATPTQFHRQITIEAAQAGKHVLCEKPMAVNAGECQEMIAAADKHGVKLQIGFMRRFDAGFIAAKSRIELGQIGQVVLVKSLTHGPNVPKPWMYDIRKSNGPLAEVSSHDIDTLRWFTESEFEEVYAIAGNYRCEDARAQYPDFYDNFVMTVRLANGMQGLICGAQGVGYAYDARLEVLGTRGILLAGDLRQDSVTVCASGMDLTSSAVKSWWDLFAPAYACEARGFIDCIRADREPVVTGFDGLQAVKVVNAGNRSIVERRPVRLD